MKTIANAYGSMVVRFQPEYSAICSIGKAPFSGDVLIEYIPDDKLLELVSVEEWIHGFAKREVVIEELARLIFDEMTRALGDIPRSVTVTARTTVHAPASAIISRRWVDE
jgi:NADPH-dependent 7-cyano-7-deazaguanine reductase QueF